MQKLKTHFIDGTTVTVDIAHDEPCRHIRVSPYSPRDESEVEFYGKCGACGELFDADHMRALGWK